MHEDRLRSPASKIDKAEWERIFGKPEDVRMDDPRADVLVKRARARKDSDDFTGGGLKGKKSRVGMMGKKSPVYRQKVGYSEIPKERWEAIFGSNECKKCQGRGSVYCPRQLCNVLCEECEGRGK